MKQLSISVDVFEYQYNNISCSCIFKPDYQEGFSITFVKKSTGTIMKLFIKPGYDLQINGRDFSVFCNFFEIGRGKGVFSMKDFINHFNNHIPIKPSDFSPEKRKLVSKVFKVEESDKVFFDYLINWDKIRAQNPNITSSRSKKNLDKTKMLYPEIYKEIKNYDISVAYSTIEKNFNLNEIKKVLEP